MDEKGLQLLQKCYSMIGACMPAFSKTCTPIQNGTMVEGRDINPCTPGLHSWSGSPLPTKATPKAICHRRKVPSIEGQKVLVPSLTKIPI